MKKILVFFFMLHFFISLGQYKPKFLLEFNTPRRVDIGIKFLSNKSISYSIKCGYQFPFFHSGLYRGKGTNFSKVWGLSGLVINASSEVLLKNPHHAFCSDIEYSVLSGSFHYPNYFNTGRDYGITMSKANGISYAFLLGYYFHFYKNLNKSLFFKIGCLYREVTESIYFESYSRIQGSPNKLNSTINNNYFETEFAFRIGLQYCFGYKKLFSK